MENKECISCGITKPLDDFRTKGKCKQCIRDYHASWSKENKNKIRNYHDKSSSKENIYIENKKCSLCNEIKPAADFYKHSTSLDGLRPDCKKCKNLSNQKRHKVRYRDDSVYNFIIRNRSSIRHAFKGSKSMMGSKLVLSLLGVSNFSEAKNYISKLFKEGMSWDNYGEWEIDHIIEFSTAETINDAVLLFHHKNTQPLWKADHDKKTLMSIKEKRVSY